MKPSTTLASTVSRPSLLERVGAQLVEQADATAFLTQVDDDATARRAIWRMASASCGPQSHAATTEHLAGEALRVNADEQAAAAGDLATNERHVPLAAIGTGEEVELELPRCGGKARAGDLLRHAGSETRAASRALATGRVKARESSSASPTPAAASSQTAVYPKVSAVWPPTTGPSRLAKAPTAENMPIPESPPRLPSRATSRTLLMLKRGQARRNEK